MVPIQVPPLRERREDIAALIEHFLVHAARRLQRDPCTLKSTARDLLLNYHWPGNVRELENIITRASVLNLGQPIEADELRPWLIAADESDVSNQPLVPVGLSLHEMERKLIEATLERFGGHRAKTAEALGIGIRTLSGKLKAFGYPPRAKIAARAVLC